MIIDCASCRKDTDVALSISEEDYGSTLEDMPVKLYTLTNTGGMQVKITNFGGTVVSICVKDREGNFDDVVLGYDSLEGYINDTAYFGGIIGRFCNRIGNARFTLDGVEYILARNNADNHLHGGIKGFNKVLWDTEEIRGDDFVGLTLSYNSQDGEENYPGNLQVEVTYKLTDSDELKIDYRAKTDKKTILNLTNHSYFNLTGAGGGNILGHELMLNADRFTPVDNNLIPTGELLSVDGTPLDFRQSTVIGARINQEYDQLVLGGGYDHNWVLNSTDVSLTLAARVYEPTTGRILEVETTQPGIQFYSGNFLDGSATGKGGQTYHHRYGFCLETQHYPDSPNRPEFPSTVLNPGEQYIETTVFRFLTK